MKSRTIFAALALMLLVTGCETTGSGDLFCKQESPRYFTSAEINTMSDENALANAEHNEYGRKKCGWKTRK